MDIKNTENIGVAPINSGANPFFSDQTKKDFSSGENIVSRDPLYSMSPVQSKSVDASSGADNKNEEVVTPTERRKIVEIKDVSVVYNIGKNNEAMALDGIDLEIYAEEYVIFFGPSGCGKSTLLNIISGLEIPSKGNVWVEGQNLAELSSNELAKFHCRRTGMVFQSYNLIPTLDILDNIVLPQMFERKKPADRKKTGRELLEKMDLQNFEKRLPQELSGGQQQRVCICRALINNPPIILADEAVGNLDSVSADNVLGILDTLNMEEKKTIISVTHNPEHLFYADRIFYLRDGKIIKVEINEKRRHIERKEELTGTGDSDENKEGEIKKIRNELDLLLQAYPDLSSMQLHMMLAPFKAKMLVAYLISNLESEEISRMEKIITDRLLGRIGKKELLELFDAEFEKGGLGLYKNKAANFSEIIEEVVDKSDYLRREKNDLKECRVDQIKEVINIIRQSLLYEFDGDLTLDQAKALDKGIEYRIFSKISKSEFKQFLDMPYEEGGVGLNKRSAANLAKKMELIMLIKFGS